LCGTYYVYVTRKSYKISFIGTHFITICSEATKGSFYWPTMYATNANEI